MSDLVEFEVELMQAMNDERPAFPWGSAVGPALEVLEGRGLVERVQGQYRLSDAGRQELERRRKEDCADST